MSLHFIRDIDKTKKQCGISVRELTELALLAAITFIGKLAFGFLPNIHPVTLMLIGITLVYGWKAFYATVVYIGLEIAVFGFGIWNLSYFYAWPLLVLAVQIMRKTDSRMWWSFLACMHGLLFGAMCSLPYFVTGGIGCGISYWIAGIPYDILHGISNGVIVFFLLSPLRTTIERFRL